MTYLLVGMAMTTMVAGIVAAAAMAASRIANATITDLKAKLAAMEVAGNVAKATTDDEKVRLEKVIASLKAEIELLEKDHAACATPDSVRSRLRGLLSGPSETGPASGGVPPVPPTR